MAFVIRFFDGHDRVSYWDGKGADTEKGKAKLFSSKEEADKVLKRIDLAPKVTAKVIFAIWLERQKRTRKPRKQNTVKSKKVVELVSGFKGKQSGPKLGKVTAIRYIAESDGKKFEFEHVFAGKLPDLVVDKQGKELKIRNNFEFTKHGITDR